MKKIDKRIKDTPATKKPEYRIWSGIKQRCYNKNTSNYLYYGAKGIKMDEEWENSFWSFFNYVGPRPTEKHSIDRIDNNGNYEPGNVRWATYLEQTRNRNPSKEYEKRIIFRLSKHNYSLLDTYALQTNKSIEDSCAELIICFLKMFEDKLEQSFNEMINDILDEL